jgi:hypothetical protein
MLSAPEIQAVFPSRWPFRPDDIASAFEFLAELKRPIHSDPTKKMLCDFPIDPSVDLDLVNLTQLPNLVYDLRCIHMFFPFQSRSTDFRAIGLIQTASR